MQRARQSNEGIPSAPEPLIQQIVAITSRRRRLTRVEEGELSRFVASRLTESDLEENRSRSGNASLQSYLTVVIQRLYDDLAGADDATGRESSAAAPPGSTSPLDDASATSAPSAREALILKMWFQSGMTTQKIASVLAVPAREVHTVITEKTHRFQDHLAHHTSDVPND